MIIITELADGRTEIFESESYVISGIKDFHPLICKVSVYSGNKKIKSISRPHKWYYKHFTFKSEKVQSIIRNLEEQKRLSEQAKGE